MVSKPDKSVDELLRQLINQPVDIAPTTSNNDITNYQRRARSSAADRAARRNAQVIQDRIVDKEKEVELQRQAFADIQETNPSVAGDSSWFNKAMSALDFTGKHIARPAMGSLLSYVFAIDPRENAGERELREAGARNPIQMILQPERREEVRKALEETKLPFGVYTALEMGLDPLNFVPLGYVTKGAKGGLKALSKGAKTESISTKAPVAEVIPRLPDLEQTVNLNMSDNAARKLGLKLASIPLAGRAVTAMNPTLKATEVTDIALIGLKQQEQMGAQIAAQAADVLKADDPFKSKRLATVFEKRDGGLSKEWSKGATELGEGFYDIPVYGIAHHHDLYARFDKFSEIKKYLTTEEKAHVELMNKHIDESTKYLEDLGVIPKSAKKIAEAHNELDKYFPRLAKERNLSRKVTFAAGDPSGSGLEQLAEARRLGTLPDFFKSRYWDEILDGFDNGVRYEADEYVVLQSHLRGVYRVAAEANFGKHMEKQGLAKISSDVVPPAILKNLDSLRTKSSAARILLQQYDIALADPTYTATAYFKNTGKLINQNEQSQKFLELLRQRPGWTTGRKLEDWQSKLKNERTKVSTFAKDNNTRLEKVLARKKEFETNYQTTKSATLNRQWRFNQQNAEKIDAVLVNQAGNLAKRLEGLNDASRGLLTGFDMGAPFIQGIPLLFNNPVAWTKAVGHSFNVLRKPELHAQFKKANNDVIQEAILKGGVPFSEAEQVTGLIRKSTSKDPFLTKIPKVGRGIERFGYSFNAFGDAARVHMWAGLKPSALKKALASGDQAEIDRAYKELGDVVSKTTGTLTNERLGILPKQASKERIIGFAPRYYRASFGVMADVFQGGLRGTAARDALKNVLVGGVFGHMATAAAFGQEPKLDPRKSDFMTVNISGQNVGIGTIWLQTARMFGKVVNQTSKNNDAGMLLSLDSKDNPFVAFGRGRTSPLLGSGWDLATGRDFIGRPTQPGGSFEQNLDFVKGIERRFLPIWAQELAERSTDSIAGLVGVEGTPDMPSNPVISPLFEFAGMRTLPDFIWDRRAEREDELAQKYYGKNWNDLESSQKEILKTGSTEFGIEQDKELMLLYEEQRRYNLEQPETLRLRTSQYFDEKAKIKSDKQKDIDTAEKGYREGELTARQFRDAIANTGRAAGVKHGQLDNQEYWVPVKQSLAQKQEREVTSVQPLETIFSDKFFDLIYMSPDIDEKDPATGEVITRSLYDQYGQYQFDERERRIETIKNELRSTLAAAGNEASYDETWAKVLNMVSSRNRSELVLEIDDGQKYFRSYWEIGDIIAEEQGVSELWARWKRFGDRDPELLPQEHILKAIDTQVSKAREQARKQNQALDAWLYKWEYTNSLMHKENIKLGKQFIRSADFSPLTQLPLD